MTRLTPLLAVLAALALAAPAASGQSAAPPSAPKPPTSGFGELTQRQPATTEEEDDGLPVWAWVLIGVGLAAVVCGGAVVWRRRRLARGSMTRTRPARLPSSPARPRARVPQVDARRPGPSGAPPPPPRKRAKRAAKRRRAKR
ncbi:MAG TPA: hypothetical protein VK279_05420 [Solirubrobacteraceae bacterium]|nr:hypothetical protein [Solirubrobacteraceae bacterium]